ncbi:hypothetical protein E1265_07010 [Streptomyces sp. 8K308]|uniref:hypothetical protein n=1 Tax=Streptomyces sp. 8K308 TaxID=2530388 RepID=UPI0010516C7F|nr:hypothetical protein [Streptomyces sp. 8K308]TDC25400.1 hypothetical protein E1265_07010 [Streptomyces sp. 8K308]
MSPRGYGTEDTAATASSATTPPVQARVHTQMTLIATYAFTVLLPLVLVVLVLTSAWTGWVTVMAMHTYLDQPSSLPGAMWAVPVAVQAFVIVGEATMVLNSVLRRRWIMASGAAATAAGYGAEVGAHVYYGEGIDTVITMIVAAVACGGGWALVAGLMDRGVEIADRETASAEWSPLFGADSARAPGSVGPTPTTVAPTKVGRGADATPTSVVSLPKAASATIETPSSAADDSPGETPTKVKSGARRNRRELLRQVEALAPGQPTLSPNFVANRVGVSWSSARSLLAELGRLADADPRSQERADRSEPARSTLSPGRPPWSPPPPPRHAWGTTSPAPQSRTWNP